MRYMTMSKLSITCDFRLRGRQKHSLPLIAIELREKVGAERTRQRCRKKNSKEYSQAHFRIRAGIPGRPGSRRLGVLVFCERVL